MYTLILIWGIGFFIDHNVGMRRKKILIVKREVPYDTKTVGNNAKFEDIAEVPIDVQLPDLINPKTFLGDAAFDTVELYKFLLTGNTFGDSRHFSKAYIPLNARSGLENQDYTLNADGIPCCPLDPSLPMKSEGSKSNLRSGIPTLKFVCPKMKWSYNKTTGKCHRECFCMLVTPML